MRTLQKENSHQSMKDLDGVQKKVGIVGGGILGVTLGYLLSQKGAQVEIFEASATLGGLAGSIVLPDGTPVDRFYHAILSSDSNLGSLCEALGIENQLRFRETQMGFYHRGELYSMNSILDFARFPVLGWVDRFRLGLTILKAQSIRDWERLERESVESWLIRWGGRSAYENIWRPMLKAKFDGSFDSLPATYIWSRLVRMKSTRTGAQQKEMAGHLIGGYQTLLEAMVDRIRAAGGKIHLNTPVEEIMIHNGIAWGIRVGGQGIPFDAIAATPQTPIFLRLIPDADSEYRKALEKIEYLGILTMLLVMDRPLSDYWTMYITDDSRPFTGIIETTSYIDPVYVGGHHLVYLPKYVSQQSEWFLLDDDTIRERWLGHLQKMFPEFQPEWVRYCLIHRERFVEPIRSIYETRSIPAINTPVAGLYLATTAQIYPQLTNGESVSTHAQTVCDLILERSPEKIREITTPAA